jgi:hypothetical protein
MKRLLVCQTAACVFLVASLPPGPTRAATQTRDPKPVPVIRIPQPSTAPSAPPRDRVPAPQVGTGALRGRVVDGVTGRAVARARVRLFGSQGGQRPSTLTDSSGAFAFSELPPGSYFLGIEKSSYLPGRFPDQGRTFRNRMRPLAVQNGSVLDDITVPVFRGGVITGRIVDAYGEPVEGANVMVMTVTRTGRPAARSGAQANDLGEFRVPRLQSGRYVLRVSPPNMFQPGAEGEQPLPQPLPTYYPGTLSLDQAQPIAVNRGETASGIDMMLAEGTPTLVTGIVLMADGQTIGGGGVSARRIESEARLGGGPDGGTGIDPGGRFRLQLSPGEYVLEANVTPRSAQNLQPRFENQLFGTLRLTVGASPMEDVSILVGKGATASGRVVFEGATPPPVSPGTVRVPLSSPDGQGCRSGQATIAPDWTFKVEGLGGTCGAVPGFARWMVKSVVFRGQNLADETITFEAGQHYGDVQVVVTDKRTQMDLRVTDQTGQATRDYVALAFPADKTRWKQLQRYVRTYSPPPPPPPAVLVPPPSVVSPPQIGMAAGMIGGGASSPRIVGLPPGEYYVIAIDDMEIEDSQDPGVLERLIPSALRVAVSDDAPIEVPLQRILMSDVIR